MSGNTVNRQNPWDETEEEVMRRLERAQSESHGWLGTIIGATLALAALVLLLSWG